MEFGWFHDDEAGLSELNITPLVDVALVLLIIFMITAPMLVQGANVDLPQTRPMNKLPSGNVFLNITATAEIFMNDDETAVDLADLGSRIFPLVQLGQAVYIQADVAITYGQFMEVMDAVKAAGAQVNLVTLPKPPDAR
jgi:biopolymer transport protein TolR